MSLRYLEKAREENGYSDYKDSTALSKSAVDWAERAVSAVEMGGSPYNPGGVSVPMDTSEPAFEDEPPANETRETPADVLPVDDLPADDDLLEDE